MFLQSQCISNVLQKKIIRLARSALLSSPSISDGQQLANTAPNFDQVAERENASPAKAAQTEKPSTAKAAEKGNASVARTGSEIVKHGPSVQQVATFAEFATPAAKRLPAPGMASERGQVSLRCNTQFFFKIN